ncbi:MAG: hypothetical protein NTZ74_00300 [Chloroflexi bacterium]|nr:hypothetical protein [Chloroflexota bacterium]
MPRLILICLLSMLTLSPAQPQLWIFQSEKLIDKGRDLTALSVIPLLSFSKMDFGNPEDCIVYTGQAIALQRCSGQLQEVLWESEKEWDVREAIVADLNHDQSRELVMVVWRPYTPWPIDRFLPSGGRIQNFHDLSGMSCHLILVGWDGEKYRELWAGSALKDPISHIRAADLDGDGNQELIALESQYDSDPNPGQITLWGWSGFGFRLQDRSDESFENYALVSQGARTSLLTVY